MYYTLLSRNKITPELISKRMSALDDLSIAQKNLVIRLLKDGHYVSDLSDTEFDQLREAYQMDPDKIEIACIAINKGVPFAEFMDPKYDAKVAAELLYASLKEIDLTPYITYGSDWMRAIRLYSGELSKKEIGTADISQAIDMVQKSNFKFNTSYHDGVYRQFLGIFVDTFSGDLKSFKDFLKKIPKSFTITSGSIFACKKAIDNGIDLSKYDNEYELMSDTGYYH